MYRPAGSYLFKVNNGNAIKMSEIYAKLIKKILERVNDIALSLLLTLNVIHFSLVFLLLTLRMFLLAGQ